MERYLLKYLKADLKKKILLVTGPRQSGKTTLSKMLSSSYDYFNYDVPEHRMAFRDKSWDREKKYVIFDELHKMKLWKGWLKGIFDSDGISPGILVTGSARLDTYRKVGDSLAGRFFQFRLHPLDVREICHRFPKQSSRKVLDRLLTVGGFPEPYLEGTEQFYNRWKRSHLDIILRQDMIDLESVKDIVSMETLIELLRRRVGSPISYQALAEDLQCSDKTVKRWLNILENMYVVFKISPFHKNIARSNLKRPKYYFYDVGQVKADLGIKLENLAACSLLKECQFRQDCFGESFNLQYLSKKGGKEIDFLISKDDLAHTMIEVKLSEENPSPNFKIFEKELENVGKVQLVKNLSREKTYPNGLEIREISKWLTSW